MEHTKNVSAKGFGSLKPSWREQPRQAYQGGVGAHFVDRVDREKKAAGLDGIP